MPYDELIKWTEYFKKRPVNWDADYRAFLLMKSFGAKGNPEDYFVSLRQIKVEEENSKTETAGKVLPKGKFLDFMRKAKGGDKLENKPWEN
jgi:hypothetical protein